MAGYYVPSSYSANYVANKKDNDGTYVYDSAINRAGIDAQRNLQQLNKQYNMTINNAYAQSLLANRGLQASSLGTGYKQAFAQNLQKSMEQEVAQVGLSVQDAKQSIFERLGQDLSGIASIQQGEVDNMRRMASSLEKYHDYLKTLTAPSSYLEDQGFKVGDEFTFEDNYDKIFSTQKGIISAYLDEQALPGLSWEDWLRQNSGNTDKDTAWLDWVYTSGLNQYKDFIKNGTNSIY